MKNWPRSHQLGPLVLNADKLHHRHTGDRDRIGPRSPWPRKSSQEMNGDTNYLL
ncbi:hypothetical protein CROQUDRAFT_659704 [Cronartium quercuum f. sp. fusiforme G11]|uniref:Uncharacterized protein n=1 Tax=Cronartium quercuum f. sp. fusiforme G11 TaxID=708437 RepID=A0A9P6NEV0_9BASI|nr:hypothetical protein CROQUDRAFT_659704 [Cronartium quercuum f. sp. fusiforme G11]